MDDYIPKPYSINDLSDTLGRWLSRYSRKTFHGAENNTEMPTVININTYDDKATGFHYLLDNENRTPAIFDQDALLKRLMGDEDLLNIITEGFLSDIPQQISLLKNAIHNGDIHTAVEQAHKIKGAAGNISATALQETAHSTEVAGKTGDMKSLVNLIAALELQFNQLKKHIGSKE
jgi:HPt (histidine-containing phosphotransfer) domain-containing protein